MKQFYLKHKLVIIIASVLIAISIAYYVIFIYNADAGTQQAPNNGPSANPKKIIKNPNQMLSYPVQAGDVGKQVKQLQKYLNIKYKASLTADGVWGAKTQIAFERASFPTNVEGMIYVTLTLALYNKLNLNIY
jgi:hypothetical protein